MPELCRDPLIKLVITKKLRMPFSPPGLPKAIEGTDMCDLSHRTSSLKQFNIATVQYCAL
jgi:hypothetical protein